MGEGGEFGFEIDILVGDVEGEDAVRCEVSLVEGDCLGGEQVERDGVSRESVDDEEVVVLSWFGGERGAGIAFGVGEGGGGLAEIGEEVLCDGQDGGVDLVEAEGVSGMSVGG